MADKAWSNQAASLVEVQQFGGNLERTVRNSLGWEGGRVVYDFLRKYRIQVDCIYPSVSKPEVIVSVTYSNPDSPGHSNENKLQLKLGELALMKNAYPDIRAILVLGGTREAWLQYVIAAFQFFFDKVLFLWDTHDADELLRIGKNPQTVTQKHQPFWTALRASWKSRILSEPHIKPPLGLVRYAILDILVKSSGASTPKEIKNEIARHCMEASLATGGAVEWNHFLAKRWQAIEMSRSYFNPVEAATDLLLRHGRFKFEGGLARDVEISSLLHQLGMKKTKMSEDFVLYSEKLKCPVYIQCKASGGGRTQHGKNIQNRTKEQVARGLLYTAQIDDQKQLVWKEKKFHWIGIVDGDWGVTKREALKYVHMLELAGYDKLIPAADLLNPDFSLKRNDNPLIVYLNSLNCRRN